MTVSEQLRDAIRRSGKTNYRIGIDVGISISTVDRFLKDEKPASTDTFDVLCEYFGLELRPKKGETERKEGGKKAATKRKQRKKAGE